MGQRDEIYAKLVSRMGPLLNKRPEELTDDVRFDALGVKSVHYSQITTFLEDAFDVEIPYMTFRRKQTIGEAADYVLQLVENG